jgi:hypothetical protein
MLTKDKVRKTIDRLPDNFTEGRVFTTDQVKTELKTWLK